MFINNLHSSSSKHGRGQKPVSGKKNGHSASLVQHDQK